MPVELVPRIDSTQGWLGQLQTDGHRDGASDLGNAGLVTDHAYEPRGREYHDYAPCVCGLYIAAHANDGLPF